MHGFVTGLTPEDNQAIAAQLYVEMLKAGYTAVGEFHYVHLDPDGEPYSMWRALGYSWWPAWGGGPNRHSIPNRHDPSHRQALERLTPHP